MATFVNYGNNRNLVVIYIQSDPIGLEGGSNAYAYVLNSPLKYIDPDGLVSVLVGGSAEGSIGGGGIYKQEFSLQAVVLGQVMRVFLVLKVAL